MHLKDTAKSFPRLHKINGLSRSVLLYTGFIISCYIEDFGSDKGDFLKNLRLSMLADFKVNCKVEIIMSIASGLIYFVFLKIRK